MKKLMTLGVLSLAILVMCDRAPETGTIEVTSDPTGADVFLDDSLTGQKTNCTLEDVPLGRHKLTLTLAGYDNWERYVEIGEESPDGEINAGLTDTTEGNHSPVILSVSASPNPVDTANPTTITCTAEDQDSDSLTYEWESVDEDTTYTGQSFVWIAPETEGNYLFYLIVSDGNEGFDYDSSLVITVEIPGISSVTLLPATDIGTNEATLIWTSAEPSWSEYRLYRSDTPDVPTFGQLIATLSDDNGYTRLDTAYTDTDLNPGTDYYYAVLVTDSAANEAWSNEILVTTQNFEFLGSQSLGGGHGVRLAHKDIYIFCAAREQAVKGFTITNSGPNPAAIISHPNGNNSAWAYDLAITGNLLHVAFGKGGYMAYDIANPLNPDSALCIDEATLGGEVRAVFALGSAIFVGCTDPATATHTLVYFDYINPGTLFIDTIYDIPEDIYVTNNYIYVAKGHAGMEILSWNPTAPDPMQPVCLFSTYDAAHRVYVSGQYAYVAGGSEGLLNVDVSNPASPYLAGQWQDDIDGNDAQGLYFSGVRCYLADGDYGLRVLDITIPIYPEHIDTKDLSVVVGTSKLMDVVVRSEGAKTQAVLADWNNAVHMIEW